MGKEKRLHVLVAILTVLMRSYPVSRTRFRYSDWCVVGKQVRFGSLFVGFVAKGKGGAQGSGMCEWWGPVRRGARTVHG